jgi:hypothetical protein
VRGKTIFKFRKNQHVFGAKRRRGHGILHSKRQGQATVLSDQGKETVVGILDAPALGRRLLEWLKALHRNHDGDGRSLDHGDHDIRDDRRSSWWTQILGAIHGVSHNRQSNRQTDPVAVGFGGTQARDGTERRLSATRTTTLIK